MQPEFNELQQRIEELRPLVEQICQRLDDEVTKLGFITGKVQCMKFPALAFSLQTDPYSQKQALQGVWKNPPSGQNGTVMFNVDGTFYAECDVVRPHPGDQRWFVESITAWGKDDSIRAEPKLLPALSP